ncbi:hypothetical protein SLH49_15705 [Cognatiyoonia sp. IB215446]|uniref:hypothetical protein n=1 Tax=Cognatiyoonia sp. IB215446 TaxID=3097355 RepID=UPI002A15E609|nr:hypothetical protein [Cognatiyoonia sp. IB215446]MDX8349432.1 hypothetical protein [Cognatiyoonia sp. IB215446]
MPHPRGRAGRGCGAEPDRHFCIQSLGLFFGGALAPLAGRWTDQFGRRVVMTVGSLEAGIVLILPFFLMSPYGLFVAMLLAEAAAMCVLYNVAFAAVAGWT